MTFAWILVLIAAMVSTRAKVKKERAGPSKEDYELPESEDTIDLEALVNEDDDEVVENASKDKQPMEPGSPIRKYTRRRSQRHSGVHINEPRVNTRSQRRESPWIEGSSSPTMPSLPPMPTRRDTRQDSTTTSSIRREQQRLAAEQEKLASDFKLISAEQQKISFRRSPRM